MFTYMGTIVRVWIECLWMYARCRRFECQFVIYLRRVENHFILAFNFFVRSFILFKKVYFYIILCNLYSFLLYNQSRRFYLPKILSNCHFILTSFFIDQKLLYFTCVWLNCKSAQGGLNTSKFVYKVQKRPPVSCSSSVSLS